MIALAAAVFLIGTTTYSIFHVLYLVIHAVVGPLGAFLAYRKGYWGDGQSVLFVVVLGLAGLEGLLFGALVPWRGKVKACESAIAG